MASFDVVEASIEDLQLALSTSSVTSVDLVAAYLRRIARYDCRGPCLNSIPILNSHVFDEAAESDDRRASGQTFGRLEGIPYTVKDSYKVKGMTVASGSPAFKNLVANEDAFTAAAIRAQGGIVLGRTNMPPMAYGGMQRGVYGRAESPYNPEYLAAAWASGSSNGSAVSTAASFAAFGMGEETVSSGRSPASNNAVVAYTPSRGWISIRGNWPLYLTCDVIVPHTRSMSDLLALLEVITARDPSSQGDFWRDQPFVKLAEPWGGAPSPTPFQDISESKCLAGLRFAVPEMYIGGPVPWGAREVFVSEDVRQLWSQARKRLEALGAEIVVVSDFPAVTAYETPGLSPQGTAKLPEDWNWYERGPLVAHGWDQFLRANGDAHIPGLSAVNELEIWPDMMRTEAELDHFPASNSIHWGRLAQYTERTSIYEVKNLGRALHTLEDMRRQLFDDYLAENDCDGFVFPAQGDVAAADSDVAPSSAEHAWRNGVWYSNGNRALRHLGIPSVTVSMGEMATLLAWVNAYEKTSRMRTTPRYTPKLSVDEGRPTGMNEQGVQAVSRPNLEIDLCSALPDTQGSLQIHIQGRIWQERIENPRETPPVVEIIVDGEDVSPESVNIGDYRDDGLVTFSSVISCPAPVERNEREAAAALVARDLTMVVVLGRSVAGGRPSGYLGLV